ncbi:hypothetical protein SAMN06298226_2007 [Nitrosovibrio sp. Nv4]|nr:hypothetical protein SAMN06298226_2007 [Nitrosovibrio sp. Nv4]
MLTRFYEMKLLWVGYISVSVATLVYFREAVRVYLAAKLREPLISSGKEGPTNNRFTRL